MWGEKAIVVILQVIVSFVCTSAHFGWKSFHQKYSHFRRDNNFLLQKYFPLKGHSFWVNLKFITNWRLSSDFNIFTFNGLTEIYYVVLKYAFFVIICISVVIDFRVLKLKWHLNWNEFRVTYKLAKHVFSANFLNCILI